MLKSIKRVADEKIVFSWQDGHVSVFENKFLRNSCPCASCKGETVLMHHYTPMPQVDLPGRNEIKNISQVGSYAIQIFWGDGHDTGIFSFDYLRNICECEICNQKIIQ